MDGKEQVAPVVDDIEADDYWTSEPVTNKAVAEWWKQQPEGQGGVGS